MKPVSISFVIPYYKVPFPLLRRCVDSVRALDGHVDWEIRLVDDGTPGNEAEQYLRAQEEPRIHYHAQKNQGLSMARNNGWSFCTKEYVQFLDADDYLFLTPTLQAIELLEKEHPDLLAFDARKVYGEELTDTRPRRSAVKFRGSGTAYMLRHNLHGSAWGYVFRREAAGDLRFTPGIYHEDEDFTPLLWLRMQHIIVTGLPVYAYYQRQGSILHDADERKIGKRYEDLISILVHLSEEARLQPSVPARALRRRADMLAMSIIYTLMKESPNALFLRDVLRRMGDKAFYPLPPARWSLLYSVFRLCTLRPSYVCLLSRWVFLRRSE